jgi:hypothetical protein
MASRDHLKSEHLNLDAREALAEPPAILLGVSQEAEQALEKLDIHSVFDLALVNAASHLGG